MNIIKILFFICIAMISLQSCCFYGGCNDEEPFMFIEPVSAYTPVILNRPEFEESVTLLPAKPVVNAGKIYVIGDLLFISEKNEGFHVYSNTDPTNPVALNFIKTPGASDVSIKNGVYYINQAVDLIAITYTAFSSDLFVSKRIENVFPSMVSPDGFYYYGSENEIVVNWILTP